MTGASRPYRPDLLAKLKARLDSAKAIRADWETAWRAISATSQPQRSRFLSAGRHRGPRIKQPYKDYGIIAARTLAAGMYSGLSSPSRPWFALATEDEELMEFDPVRSWLETLQKAINSLLSSTNFYSSVYTSYVELGLFGAEGSIMLDHFEEFMVTHAQTAGEFWITVDDALRVSAMFRRVPMSAEACIGAFPLENVPRSVRGCYERGDYSQEFTVYHACYRNDEAKAGFIDKLNMPWRSVWWLEDSGIGDGVLDVGGYHEQPFTAARWEPLVGDAWGPSPGLQALPSLTEVENLVKEKGHLIKFLARPPLAGPAIASDAERPILEAGRYYPHERGAVDQARPLYEPDPQAVLALREELNALRVEVDRAYYADLFQAITQMEGVQPRNQMELTRRYEEQLIQLGPVVERTTNEKLAVTIKRAMGLLFRAGALPPPPPELAGAGMNIRYVGLLAQMQQMVGLKSIETTIGFIMNLGASDARYLDKLDGDQAIDEFARIAGSPAKMLRGDDAVAKIRADRAQIEQAMQLAALAEPARAGADALKTMAEVGR